MVDVLLTHSNHLFHDRKQVQKMQPYPPLQTLLAAACLRRKGYSVAVFDSTLDEPEAGFKRSLALHRPRLVAVVEDNFNFLTKMCLLRNRELAFWFAQTACEAGVPAIVNGADATDHAADYLDAGFDCVLRGEVEETLGEAARYFIEAAGELSGVRGIAYRDGTRLEFTEPRAPIADLDFLPGPAWDLLDAEPYRRAWTTAHGYFSLNLVSSRGCPYRCNWCAKPIWSDQYRCRSPRLVAEEMLEVKTRFQPDHLWFADDIFGTGCGRDPAVPAYVWPGPAYEMGYDGHCPRSDAGAATIAPNRPAARRRCVFRLPPTVPSCWGRFSATAGLDASMMDRHEWRDGEEG